MITYDKIWQILDFLDGRGLIIVDDEMIDESLKAFDIEKE